MFAVKKKEKTSTQQPDFVKSIEKLKILSHHVLRALAHTVEMSFSNPVHLFPLSDAPVSELSLELLLLQVVLPALLEQGHTRQWLKGLVRAWTVSAGYLL